MLKFAHYTGAVPIAGRYTPGMFTNQIQAKFREPRLLIVSDPRFDHQVCHCLCMWDGRRGGGGGIDMITSQCIQLYMYMYVGERGLLLGNPASSIMLSGTPFSKDAIPAGCCCFSNFFVPACTVQFLISVPVDHEYNNPGAHFLFSCTMGGGWGGYE